MKLATILHGGEARLGTIDEASGTARLLSGGPATMLDLIRGDEPPGATTGAGGEEVPLAGVRLLAPIPRPSRNIFCVGKNYHEHAREFAQSGFDSSAGEVVPEVPVVFTKPPSAVIGPRRSDPAPPRPDRFGRLRGRADGGDRAGRARHRRADALGMCSATRSSTT